VQLNLQTVARALGDEINAGQVLAPGPNHSPKDRSLSVKLDAAAPDGFVVHSFSKDDPLECKDYVRKKLGLPSFKPNGKQHKNNDFITAAVMAAAMAQGRRSPNKKGRIVATYDYTDEQGTLLYQVCRFEPKDFRQRRPDGNGGWTWKLLDDRRVLYRLPDLLKYPDATILFCEGEKDCDRVASLGLCATTVASGKWTEECAQALAGRDVWILQDNGDKGRSRAREAAEQLQHVANSIRIILLPDLPPGGGVSDWFDGDRSHTADRFAELCFETPEWKLNDVPEIETKAEEKATESTTAAPPLPFINVIAWQGEPVPQRAWIVKDRIPDKAVTLLSGEGSVGKSILALHLSAAVVLARDWIGTLPEEGAALGVFCEDDTDELHRRLDRIREHYGVGYPDLKQLHLISLAGRETVMAVPDRNGVIQPTPVFKRLREAANDLRPRLTVLDNAADISPAMKTTEARCGSSSACWPDLV
jgi:AAA domain